MASTLDLITIDGITRTVEEWSDVAVVNLSSIMYRLTRGWDPKTALMAPKGYMYKQVPYPCDWSPAIGAPELRGLTVDGMTKSYTEWAEGKDVTGYGIWRRVNVYDWTPQAAITVPRADTRLLKQKQTMEKKQATQLKDRYHLKKCEICIYSEKMQSYYACLYILHTGHKRPMSPEDCDLWKYGEIMRSASVDDDDIYAIDAETNDI